MQIVSFLKTRAKSNKNILHACGGVYFGASICSSFHRFRRRIAVCIYIYIYFPRFFSCNPEEEGEEEKRIRVHERWFVNLIRRTGLHCSFLRFHEPLLFNDHQFVFLSILRERNGSNLCRAAHYANTRSIVLRSTF